MKSIFNLKRAKELEDERGGFKPYESIDNGGHPVAAFSSMRELVNYERGATERMSENDMVSSVAAAALDRVLTDSSMSRRAAKTAIAAALEDL